MTTKIDKATTKNHSLRVNNGCRFRSQRKRLNLRTADLDNHGGWSASTTYGWEAGKASPKSEFYASTQDLGFDVAYILAGHRSVRTLSGPAPAPAGDSKAIYLPLLLLSATGSLGQCNHLITEDVIPGEVPVSRKWSALHLPGCRPGALQLVHSHCDSMGDTLRSGDFAFVTPTTAWPTSVVSMLWRQTTSSSLNACPAF
ncbi:helix-turn-helix domain-containing protein [Ottowia thiooxydans]|uniref:helix-turn-helix domain-containing protein n=1 Tax=Ottowia thiooxydans TaxID=219182 RepID=UPI0006840C80|nr:helix-turn-helix domain-containing protein [Ottowia thiooxydans]